MQAPLSNKMPFTASDLSSLIVMPILFNTASVNHVKRMERYKETAQL